MCGGYEWICHQRWRRGLFPDYFGPQSCYKRERLCVLGQTRLIYYTSEPGLDGMGNLDTDRRQMSVNLLQFLAVDGTVSVLVEDFESRLEFLLLLLQTLPVLGDNFAKFEELQLSVVICWRGKNTEQ